MAIAKMSERNEAPLGLVDGPRLLEALFPIDACRPSMRWLRDQTKRRAIPFMKVGRLIFFDPVNVRESLDRRSTVRAKAV
jgi:hypothetical protein